MGNYNFAKLRGTNNYQKWQREMTNALMIEGHWILIATPHATPEILEEPVLATMTWKEKRGYREDRTKHAMKEVQARVAISNKCIPSIKQLLKPEWTAKETWDWLQKRYEPSKSHRKWIVLSRLEDLDYAHFKSFADYRIEIEGIMREVEELDITVEDWVDFKIERFALLHPELSDSGCWTTKFRKERMESATRPSKTEGSGD